MATTSKRILHDELRARYMAIVRDALIANGEEVLTVKSNEIAVPCVDSEGNDEFMVFTFKVPTGARDGEPYDGYGEAESYAMAVKEKAEKAKIAEEKKQAKIAKDKAMREAKAQAKAEHEAKGA